MHKAAPNEDPGIRDASNWADSVERVELVELGLHVQNASGHPERSFRRCDCADSRPRDQRILLRGNISKIESGKRGKRERAQGLSTWFLGLGPGEERSGALGGKKMRGVHNHDSFVQRMYAQPA